MCVLYEIEHDATIEEMQESYPNFPDDGIEVIREWIQYGRPL